MPRVFDGLANFGKFLEQRAARANPTLVAGVRAAGMVIYHSAYDTFGDQAKLQELAPATIAHREYLMTMMPAIGGSDSPLLFTGKLRASLEFFSEGLVAGVGSEDPIMQWQELGTARIPPRPVLRLSAESASAETWLVVRHYAAEMIGVAAEGGGTIYTTEIGEGRNIVNQYTGDRKVHL